MSSISPVQTNRNLQDFHQSCPHLGTFEDAEAWYSFPDSGNYCYRAKPPSQIDDQHQKTFCLSPNHANCPLLLVKDWNKPLPKEISYQEGFQIKTPVLFLLALIVLGAVGFSMYFFFEPARQALADFRANSTPTQLMTLVHNPNSLLIASTSESGLPTLTHAVQIAAITPTQTYTPSPNATASPASTATPIPPTRGPEIGTPFGPQTKYILHVVQESEPLSVISYRYQTSVEAIRASNYLIEGASIWPGKVLVILPGVRDIAGLVKFCAFYLDAPSSINELAKFLGASEEELIRYNDLDKQVDLPGKRWVIFPFQESTNPKLCK